MKKKAKGFSGKYGVTLVTMNAFLRSKKLASGGKIEGRIDRAFALHGSPRPAGISLQDYCYSKIDFIKEKGAGFKSGNAVKDLQDKLSTGNNWSCRPPPVSKKKTVLAVEGMSVTSKEFLSTYAWRELRMKAIKLYGRRCMCCGATPEHGAVINVDHIKPRLHFPELALDIQNLQILCHECNHGKGNWDATDWRQAPEDPSQIAHLRSILAGD